MAILLLLIIPVLSILVALLFRRKKYVAEVTSVVSSVAEVIVGGYIIHQVLITKTYGFLFYFSVNALNALLLGLTVFGGMIVTLHCIGYLNEELKKGMFDKNRLRLTYLLIRLFLLFIYIALLTTSPIMMWIAIEATTLVTVFMINLFSRKTDLEAAWKFLIINSIGLLLGLLGTFLFMSKATATQAFLQWKDLLQLSTTFSTESLMFAFILIFIGYGTKIGLVPMHTWKPDTYNKAPLPTVALLSTALLNVAFLAILRFTMVVNHAIGSAFTSQLFIFFGVLTVVLSASIIFTQKNLKRLLAYSTIEHAGIIALGFGFGGIGILGAMLHMLYHSLGKMALFLLASNIVVRYSTSVLENIVGMITVLPRTGVLYLLASLFIIGMPPFGMFFSEFYILLSGFMKYPFIVGAILLMLVLVFVGFVRTVLYMLYTPAPDEAVVRRGGHSLWDFVPVGIVVAMMLLFSIYIPEWVMQLVQQSVQLITTNSL